MVPSSIGRCCVYWLPSAILNGPFDSRGSPQNALKECRGIQSMNLKNTSQERSVQVGTKDYHGPFWVHFFCNRNLSNRNQVPRDVVQISEQFSSYSLCVVANTFCRRLRRLNRETTPM